MDTTDTTATTTTYLLIITQHMEQITSSFDTITNFFQIYMKVINCACKYDVQSCTTNFFCINPLMDILIQYINEIDRVCISIGNIICGEASAYGYKRIQQLQTVIKKKIV
jgi:hypothetical protein